jgi:hypothetical protein
MGVQPTVYDANELRASNMMLNFPASYSMDSEQSNDEVPQKRTGNHGALPTYNPNPAKPKFNSGTSQDLTSQMQAQKLAATTPGARSISGPAARFWTCPHCKTVLAIHKKAAHDCIPPQPSIRARAGPLDHFFRSFSSFPYDNTEPPAASFQILLVGLKKWHNWDVKDPNTWKEYREQVSEEYQKALTREFNLWFGTEDSLESWHALCRAVGVQPPPLTCEECRWVSS